MRLEEVHKEKVTKVSDRESLRSTRFESTLNHFSEYNLNGSSWSAENGQRYPTSSKDRGTRFLFLSIFHTVEIF